LPKAAKSGMIEKTKENALKKPTGFITATLTVIFSNESIYRLTAENNRLGKSYCSPAVSFL